ncbi:DUF86 domain-containing protein [Candidatus Woesearchaeota archaeon]|nr:DUF86 domain-containing protein [Candidatus Woesearchaeota archaeon]
MTRDPLLYLEDIREAINLIEKSMKTKTKDTFFKNRDLQDAIIRRLEIIGEAVKHLPLGLKVSKAIPWSDVAGMRDILSHAYFNVTLEHIWLVITKDLPILKVEIQKIITHLTKELKQQEK